MLPTLAHHPRIRLAAAADARPEARARFVQDFGGRVFPSVEDMCADPSLDVVYIATPHQFHAPHVAVAARHGKHVVVEKPMALTLAEADEIIAATARAGVVLVVGHSHSFDAPIARTRALIESGAYGRLGMISALYYTDFLYRPRRPEELDSSRGGGVLFNQLPHQVENVRMIGGGRVRSVRAQTGVWDPARPTEGAYGAFLTFENGAFATMNYSAYGHFDADELVGWTGESGQPKDPERYGATRKALAQMGTEGESAFKYARLYGGEHYAPKPGRPPLPPTMRHQHFGLLVASCMQADLRPMPEGVMVYADDERHLDALPPPTVPRAEVLEELWQAVVNGVPPLHDGPWSLASLEVCLAIQRSAQEGREIRLERQVAIPDRHPAAVVAAG
jgi:phthalate 4,5-cis-dihydrodiol dehydrogenase